MSEFHVVSALECGLLYQIQCAIVSKIYWYFVSRCHASINVLMLFSCVSVYVTVIMRNQGFYEMTKSDNMKSLTI